MKKVTLVAILIWTGFFLYIFNQGGETNPDTSSVPTTAISMPDTSATTSPATDKFDKLQKETRTALIKPCGSCHISSFPTAKTGALAIYDLDDGDQWYSKMTAEHLQGLASRAEGGDQFSEEEKKTITDFVKHRKKE